MQTNQLLTDEEMSALLGAKSQPHDAKTRVVPYNFRRPDRLSKEQIRSLYLLHDTFSHNLSSSLPLFLRVISEVSLISVEQRAFADYLSGLPDPTVAFVVSLHPLEGQAAIEIGRSLAFPVIDRMLGGPGLALDEERAVTEIEQKILEGFVHVIADSLATAWKPLVELEVEVTGRETRPQMIQLVAPNEVVISITFHVRVAEARGTMNLCLPAVMLEPIMRLFNQSSYTRSNESTPSQTRALLDTLSTLTFPVAAEVRGTRLPVDELLGIAPGDVLMLEHRAHKPVEVSVGGITKFSADLVASGASKAVQIRSHAGAGDSGSPD